MKSLGYFISIISVFLLGVAAWPTANDPPEKMWLVIGGMTASIVGMFMRYLSYRREEHAGRKA